MSRTIETLEREVGSDDNRRAFIKLTDQVEQQNGYQPGQQRSRVCTGFFEVRKAKPCRDTAAPVAIQMQRLLMIGRREVVSGALGSLLVACHMDGGGGDAQSDPIALAVLLTDKSRTRSIVVRGFRRRGDPESVTATDLWHIGSNAKAMTAALYGRLVEQGLTAWDEPVTRLFPSVSIHEGWHGTTAEQLLSHTGGLTDEGLLGAWELIKAEIDERPLPQQRLSFAAKAFSAPPTAKSGKFNYANANYVVVGAAIEQLKNAAWEAVIKSEVFDPLNMASAGFGAPGGEQPRGHKLSILPWKGLYAVAPGPAADNPPFMRPAGGVHLSLEDYAQFLRLYLNPNSKFLRPGTMKKLSSPMSSDLPYSLGWIIEQLPWTGGGALLHDGSNTMWYTTAVVAPTLGLAAIAVSNEGTDVAARATQQLAKRLLEEAGPSAA